MEGKKKGKGGEKGGSEKGKVRGERERGKIRGRAEWRGRLRHGFWGWTPPVRARRAL